MIPRRGSTLCRACLSSDLSRVIALGDHPPANAFLREDQLALPEANFPLDLFVCGRCALLQIPDHVPPDFFRHYLYVPSASVGGRHHFAGLARWLLDSAIAPPRGHVVDIGCNDGLFLAECASLDLACLGIDPASNLAPLAREKGLEVIEAYFDDAIARTARERFGAADVVVATNTLNHIDDLRAFVRAASILLADAGHLVIEVPRATELVSRNEIDTVYHEHLSQFSLRSLVELVGAFDFEVTVLEDLEFHGGSMRVAATRRGVRAPSPAIAQRLEEEQRAGLFEEGTYAAFRSRVEDNRERLVTLLGTLRRSGANLAGYGAPAKGNTLLRYCGIGTETLSFLADRSTLKQGLYSPGMHVPIAPVERIEQDRVDHLLVLAWNFLDEIREQQAAFRARGGRFIMPIPVPTLID